MLLSLIGMFLDEELAGNPAFIIAAAVMVVACIYVMVAVSVRRLHDRNRSGWWMLLYGLVPALFSPSGDEAPLVPGLPEAVGAVLTLLSAGVSVWAFVDLGILKGTSGSNRFGSDPKGAVAAEVFD